MVTGALSFVPATLNRNRLTFSFAMWLTLAGPSNSTHETLFLLIATMPVSVSMRAS